MTRTARLGVILAVSLASHLPGLLSPPLDYHYQRQTETAAVARNMRADGLPLLHPRIDWSGAESRRASTELPLYSWLLGLCWGFLGWTHTWGRVLSAASSAGTALLLFCLLRREEDGVGFVDEETAFWGAVFFSVLPVEVYFGRTIQPDATALLFSLSSAFALDRYLAAERRDAKALAWWLASAASLTLTVGLKLPYLYFAGVLAALMWHRRGLGALRDPLLWALFPAGLAPALLWYWYSNRSQASGKLTPSSPGQLLHILGYVDSPQRFLHDAFFLVRSRFPELTTTYAGLVFAFAGIGAAWRDASARFLVGWWGLVWFYSFSGGAYVFLHEYTALPFAPVNAALLGVGFTRLWNAASSSKSRALTRAALGLLVASMPIHAALRIKHWYALEFTHLLALGPVVDGLSKPDDLFLCNETARSVPLYFIHRRGWSWGMSAMTAADLAQIDDALASGAKFFLTERKGLFAAPSDPRLAAFNARFEPVFDDGKTAIYRRRG
ncbi:MAG: glycosyltransferase family 39 protein [Elusimicrobia bacterium]|nr:glycosyltransferase family 39 protein [Elusimicrobiota bacterium]